MTRNDDLNVMPKQIGPYRVRDILGEGGIAIVYLADQAEPVKRSVALKIVKVGMDTGQVVARFESERQALAVLEHPGIAKVYDAGSSDTGRPYFVMERVEGVPLTEFCNQHRHTLDQRISLVIDICAAVQHAHQKGVIHRDLKPTNILVANDDGRPIPKVIDFGIAKAIGQDLTDRTLETRIGHVIGTPQYMSPEQAAISGLDIDTRTDIYSLGVVLYELLSGALPIDFDAMSDVAMTYAIRERQPPTPSARLAELGDDLPTISSNRRTDPSALRKALQGDLDWIVMKAIEKDRERRYETASDLAADLRRHLDRLPVTAHPPSTGYLLRRFVDRNRAVVFAGAVATVALVTGTVVATMSMLRAQDAERVAVAAERLASAESATSQRISDFLVRLFEVSNPGEARGESITAREILDEAAGRIDEELTDEPATRAALLATMGQVYSNLGLYKDALPMTEESLTVRRETNAPAMDIAESLDQLGRIRAAMGEFDDAEALHIEALEITRATLGDQDPSVANTLEQLAVSRYSRGDYAGAEEFLGEALVLLQAAPEPEPLGVAEMLNNLAAVDVAQGKFDDAEDYYRQALDAYIAELGETHPDVAVIRNNLAILMRRLGNLEEAETLYGDVLSSFRRSMGDSHPQIANTLNNLAMVQLDIGKLDAALSSAIESRDMYEDLFHATHPQVLRVQGNMGLIHTRREELDEAEDIHRRTLELRRSTLELDSVEIAYSLDPLADVLNRQGRFSEAESTGKEAYEIYRDALGDDHWRTGSIQSVIAASLTAQGRFAEAEPLLLRSYEVLRNGRGQSHRLTETTREQLVDLYESLDRPTDAARYRHEGTSD